MIQNIMLRCVQQFSFNVEKWARASFLQLDKKNQVQKNLKNERGTFFF